MTPADSAESHLPLNQSAGAAAPITTALYDPLRDQVVLRLSGAVCLPPGTVIDLPDAHTARVSSTRLNATEPEAVELVVQIVRPHSGV